MSSSVSFNQTAKTPILLPSSSDESCESKSQKIPTAIRTLQNLKVTSDLSSPRLMPVYKNGANNADQDRSQASDLYYENPFSYAEQCDKQFLEIGTSRLQKCCKKLGVNCNPILESEGIGEILKQFNYFMSPAFISQIICALSAVVSSLDQSKSQVAEIHQIGIEALNLVLDCKLHFDILIDFFQVESSKDFSRDEPKQIELEIAVYRKKIRSFINDAYKLIHRLNSFEKAPEQKVISDTLQVFVRALNNKIDPLFINHDMSFELDDDSHYPNNNSIDQSLPFRSDSAQQATELGDSLLRLTPTPIVLKETLKFINPYVLKEIGHIVTANSIYFDSKLRDISSSLLENNLIPFSFDWSSFFKLLKKYCDQAIQTGSSGDLIDFLHIQNNSLLSHLNSFGPEKIYDEQGRFTNKIEWYKLWKKFYLIDSGTSSCHSLRLYREFVKKLSIEISKASTLLNRGEIIVPVIDRYRLHENLIHIHKQVDSKSPKVKDAIEKFWNAIKKKYPNFFLISTNWAARTIDSLSGVKCWGMFVDLHLKRMIPRVEDLQNELEDLKTNLFASAESLEEAFILVDGYFDFIANFSVGLSIISKLMCERHVPIEQRSHALEISEIASDLRQDMFYFSLGNLKIENISKSGTERLEVDSASSPIKPSEVSSLKASQDEPRILQHESKDNVSNVKEELESLPNSKKKWKQKQANPSKKHLQSEKSTKETIPNTFIDTEAEIWENLKPKINERINQWVIKVKQLTGLDLVIQKSGSHQVLMRRDNQGREHRVTHFSHGDHVKFTSPFICGKVGKQLKDNLPNTIPKK